MTFDVSQVLRLEIGVTPEGISNLVPNPSGDLGAWGWVTPQDGDTMNAWHDTDGPYLFLSAAGDHASDFETTAFDVVPGDYIAARFDTVSARVGHVVKCCFEFFDTTETLLSTTAQTGAYGGTAKTNYIGAVVVPAGAASARLRFDFYDGADYPQISATYIFRKVMVAMAPTSAGIATVRTNLAPNPGFEYTTVAPWTSPTTFVRSSAASVAGAYSGKLTGSGDTKVSTTVPVDPNTDYWFSLSAKASGALGLVMGATYYDAAGNPLRTVSTAGRPITIGASWSRQLISVATSPPDAVSAEIFFGISAMMPADVLYVDSVLFTTYDDDVYFNGGFTSSGPDAYAWVGTPNDSASTWTNTDFDFVDAVTWQNILGPTSEIDVDREELQLGTLSATLLDALLDPAQSDVLDAGRPIRLTATTDGDTWTPIATFVVVDPATVYDLFAKNASKRAQISLSATDNMTALSNAGATIVVNNLNELPFILEDAGVPWNADGSGNQIREATTVATMDSASVVDVVSIVRDSQKGYAWINRDNVLELWSPGGIGSTLAATFTEDDYAADGFAYGYDPATCINVVNITWLRYDDGSGETTEASYGPYEDAASVRKVGPYAATFTIAGVVEDESVIAAFANAVLAANSTPTKQVTSITVPVRSADDVWKALLDLCDLVRVTNSVAGVDESPRITAINHTITPGKWLVTYTFRANGTVAIPQETPSP